MMTLQSSEALYQFVHRLRRRWMWGYLLQRAAYCGVAVLGGVILAGIIAARAPVAPETIVALRVGTIALLLVAVYVGILRPLRRPPDLVTFARFIEEREPRLEDRLVTAVEVLSRMGEVGSSREHGPDAMGVRAHPEQFSSVLIHRLIADTHAQCSAVNADSVLPAHVLRRRALRAGTPLVLFALLAIFGPESWRAGWQRLYWPWTIAAPPTFAIHVEPGSVRIPRGLDQIVTATLQNFDADSARLIFRWEGESEWQEQPMEVADRGRAPRTFRFLFSNIQRTLEYFVEARAVRWGSHARGVPRSPTFRIEVVDWPRVNRLELLYIYPAYTGEAPRRVEDGGDITAVRGTRVMVTAYLGPSEGASGDGRVHDVRIVFDDGTSLRMTPNDSGGTSPVGFTAQIVVTRAARYHIRVQPLVGESYIASREYTITVLEDTPPTVVVEKPGRDLSVTALQEVFTEARVEDDYGVALAELRYSVNGGPEQSIPLYRASGRPARTITGSHTFFLEELNLEPGDVISYYVRARDNNAVTGPSETVSDIYFLEVRPFDRRFRQAQQAPEGQGAGERPSAFAERQKEIIAATWRVLREKERTSAEEFRANLNTLELAQTTLREDVQVVVDRIRRRVGDRWEGMEDFKKLVESLSAALREMEGALEELRAHRLKEALPFEQRAYQQLLRADSIFREIQVALASRADGGGNARAQDLADLFELELDKMKNQYETIRRDRGQARDRHLEELERKLRELAERQQRLLEQNLRREASRSGEEGSDTVEDVRELARQLDRLTRERPRADLEQVRRQLERAAREMQRARSATTESEAAAHRWQALEYLREAQRQLQSARRSQLGEEIARVRDRARQARQNQERIAREVERLAGETGRPSSPAEWDALRERKSALAEEVAQLRQQIEETARRARQENQAAAARSLSTAADTIRRYRLPESIEQGNRALDSQRAAERERAIQRALDEVVRHLDEAARNAGARPSEDRVAEARERARRLAESLASLRDRLSAQRARREGSRSESRSSPESPQASRMTEARGAMSEPSRERSAEGRTSDVRTNPLGSRGPARDSTADASAFGQPRPRAGRDWGPHAIQRSREVPRLEEALRQLRRELDERVREAELLWRNLPRDLADDAYRILAELRRLDEARLFDDPEEIERLKRHVLDPLHRLEWELSRRLPENMGADRLRRTEEAAVPPEYQRLVEAYYRRLARSPK
jgi:hypothetical protein